MAVMDEIRQMMAHATDEDVSDLMDLIAEKSIEIGMTKSGFIRLMSDAFDYAARKDAR